MQKICSKCQQEFTCTNETAGCWCEKVQLSDATLQYLKQHYENCLCAGCLTQFEHPTFPVEAKEL